MKKFDLGEAIEILTEIVGFSSKKLVGVDIGSTFVKVCEMSPVSKTKFKLNKFAIVPLPEATIIENEIQKPEEIIFALKDALKKAKISNRNLCIGLAGPMSVCKKIQVAGDRPEEIEDQVYWEAEQYIPYKTDECFLDYSILKTRAEGGSDVILAAIKKEYLNQYVELLQKEKFKVKVADLEFLALGNIFELNHLDEHKNLEELVTLVHIGSSKGHFILLKKTAPFFFKEFEIGGNLYTHEIQKQMGLNFSEAEDLKIHGDSKGNFPEDVADIVTLVNEKIALEIKKTIDFYLNTNSEDNIVKIYLTGGSSLSVGLPEKIAEETGLAVEVFDPLKNVSVSSGVKSNDLALIRSQGSVVLGLGMREIKK